MKKIGVVTWWRYNYGSILQAFALQYKLKELKVESEIICQYGKKTISISNLKEKIKRIGPKKTIKRVFWKYGLKKLRKRNKRIQDFIDNNLNISEKEYDEINIIETNKIYDGFICGSDQIWNPRLTNLDSIYWLGFVEKEKYKISYAPSMGVNELQDEEKRKIAENLKSFNAISTRESSSSNLLNSFLKTKKCQNVLDPTLLAGTELWNKFNLKRKYDFEYIFVYMLRGTKKQRKLIEEYAKKNKLKIVTMPFLDNEKISFYDFKFGDIKEWSADPIDFISLIKNAKYVFTDSFHSMLFSTMYHTSFYLFPKIGKAQTNRVLDFQKMLGIDRMISKNTSIEDIDKFKEIDWNKVEQILSEKRKDSENFLKNSLK